jgi:Lon protease (S16) C-terminal proteolytic domain
MEVDVARPAATFEYELASKDMILVHPTNGRKRRRHGDGVVSVMTGIPVRREVAMTGEITLRVRVLPIAA